MLHKHKQTTSAAPSILMRSTLRRNYEDELNFAFLMANKDKERLDRF